MAAQHRIRIGRRLRIPPFPCRFGGTRHPAIARIDDLIVCLVVCLAPVLAAMQLQLSQA
ncbi:MAG: hypothetical protein VKI63_04825 [Cyanobium sp.]|nr:hypothetical protein [Cyanobium sp.]